MISEVSDRLLALTRNSNSDIQAAAAIALGEGSSTTSAVIDRLLELTRNSDPKVQIGAITALGRIYRRRG